MSHESLKPAALIFHKKTQKEIRTSRQPLHPRKVEAALITGGAKRIGRAISLTLAEAGYDIALHYHHSRSEAKQTAAQIQKMGRRCKLFSLDLRQTDQVPNLIKDAKKSFPGLRVLVNNASIFKPQNFLQSDIVTLKENFMLHVFAPYLLSQQFARSCQRGVIINVLDRDIQKHRLSHIPYLLSKKSLSDFTDLAAMALAPGIRVNAVAPGAVLPPVGKTQRFLKTLAGKTPLKRSPNPEDIAQAVLFLINARRVTGQTLFIDGGEHLL